MILLERESPVDPVPQRWSDCRFRNMRFHKFVKKTPTLKKILLSIEQCNRYRCTLYLHSNVDSQSLRRSQNVMLLDAKIILHNSSISWLHPYLFFMISFGLKDWSRGGLCYISLMVFGVFFFSAEQAICWTYIEHWLLYIQIHSNKQ